GLDVRDTHPGDQEEQNSFGSSAFERGVQCADSRRGSMESGQLQSSVGATNSVLRSCADFGTGRCKFKSEYRVGLGLRWNEIRSQLRSGNCQYYHYPVRVIRGGICRPVCAGNSNGISRFLALEAAKIRNACEIPAHGPNKGREVGVGRTTRQPGQVRK